MRIRRKVVVGSFLWMLMNGGTRRTRGSFFRGPDSLPDHGYLVGRRSSYLGRAAGNNEWTTPFIFFLFFQVVAAGALQQVSFEARARGSLPSRLDPSFAQARIASISSSCRCMCLDMMPREAIRPLCCCPCCFFLRRAIDWARRTFCSIELPLDRDDRPSWANAYLRISINSFPPTTPLPRYLCPLPSPHGVQLLEAFDGTFKS